MRTQSGFIESRRKPVKLNLSALKHSAMTSIVICLLSGGFVVIIVMMAEYFGHSGALLVRDAAASFGFPPFSGLVSNIGISFMVATGAICLFSSFIDRSSNRSIIILAAIFSLVISIDDLLMLHEKNGLLSGVIPEKAIYLAYAVAGAWIGVLLVRRFSILDLVALLVSGSLLFLSLVADSLFPQHKAVVLIEDTFKFMGYAVWTYFWIVFCRNTLETNAVPLSDN